MYLHWDFKTLEKKWGEKKKGWKNEGICFTSVRQREPSALIIFLLEFALDCPSGGWDRVMRWVFSPCLASLSVCHFSPLFFLLCACFQLMQKARTERHDTHWIQWELILFLHWFAKDIFSMLMLIGIALISCPLIWDIRNCIWSAPFRSLCTVRWMKSIKPVMSSTLCRELNAAGFWVLCNHGNKQLLLGGKVFQLWGVWQ